MATQRFQQYQTSAVTQADPVRLVGLLFEGVVRFLNRACRSIETGDAELAHNSIMRAYAIIAELQATLDFEKGGDISRQLERVYDYILHLLREANIAKNLARVHEALVLTQQLASAWDEAFRGGKKNIQIADTPGVDAPDPTENINSSEPARGGFNLEI